MMTVNVLGTQYTIEYRDYDDDPYFAKSGVQGYCSGPVRHIIVIGNLKSSEKWDLGSDEYNELATKQLLRHEITHAFLAESGLDCNGIEIDGSWACNEEMVDWIAIQGPKLYTAWKEVGCV